MRNNVVLYAFWFALLIALGACGGNPESLPFLVAPPTPLPTPPLQSVPADVLVVGNGTVIDGTGASPIRNGIVVIQGNRIVTVGRAADFSIPAGAKVINAKGGTIMPGVINAHVHNTSNPATRRFSFLLKGVTATCDLGAPLNSISQFAQDDINGSAARGFRAGPIITAPGGYPDTIRRSRQLNYKVTNPDEARAAVVDLVNRGADVIKIALEPGFADADWPMLNPREVKVIVKEAHARGKLVRVHVTRASTLDIALEAGVDVIEHVPVPQLSEAEWKAALHDKDHFELPAAYEAQLARMVAQRVVMVPTLDVTPLVYDWYNVPPEFKPLTHKLFLEPVRRFHALGGIVALGNDYGNPGIESGMPVSEMQQLLAAGLTPMEVIQAGTSRAATVCGHGKELGTLEPGKLADIIVVDGDPLTKIEVMKQVSVIIKDGQVAYTSE